MNPLPKNMQFHSPMIITIDEIIYLIILIIKIPKTNLSTHAIKRIFNIPIGHMLVSLHSSSFSWNFFTVNCSTWEPHASPDVVVEKAPVFVAMVQDALVSSVAIVRDDPNSIAPVVVGLVCMPRNAHRAIDYYECKLMNAHL